MNNNYNRINNTNDIPPGRGYSDEDKPIDLRDLWFKFLSRRRLFFTIAIPIFLGIVIYQFAKPYSPIYRAAFDIGVTQEKPVEGIFTGISDLSTIQIGPVTQRDRKSTRLNSSHGYISYA